MRLQLLKFDLFDKLYYQLNGTKGICVMQHRIQFPRESAYDLGQDEAFFYLLDSKGKHKLRFHDYSTIYTIPGLYEQLFYKRLRCNSPEKVSELINSAIAQNHVLPSQLRVLDFGCGNGIMGEVLKDQGAARIVGVDIIPEALQAAERDRPGTYDSTYCSDFTQLDNDTREDILSWRLNCLTTVAALGFGDIPMKAFTEALNLISKDGWVGFNIKDSFLKDSDSTGFSTLIRDLLFSNYLELFQMERYCHRLSTEGNPLYYYAVSARKNSDIPQDFIDKYQDG